MNDSLKLFFDIFLFAGMFASIFVLFLLFKKKKKQLPQKILIVFFTFLFFVAFNFFAFQHKLKALFFSTFLIEDIAVMVVGPLIYLYIKSLVQDSKRFFSSNWIHLLPTVLYFFIFSIPVFISIINKKAVFGYIDFIDEHQYLFIFFGLYLTFYCLLSWRLLIQYKKAIKENYSHIDDIDIRWIKHMILGMLVTITVDNITTILEGVYGEFSYQSGLLTIVAMAIVIVYLGYYGTSQANILLPNFLAEPILQTDDSRKTTHHLSNATPEEITLLKQALSTALNENQAYLDDELTLGKLAKMISTTDKKLSALLNQYMNTSFYDLVNKKRVEAVKSKIEAGDSEQYSMLGLAFECGFKSKTSFNRIFKKETGLSPTQYKVSLQEKNT